MPNRRPTLRDVAKAAGVSPMTASNALHGKSGVKESTRNKVLLAAKRLDYRINRTASMLKSGRSNILHIVINEFDSPFYSKLAQTLSEETASRGLTPFIEQTSYSPDAAEHALQSAPFSEQLFDGEILHASGLSADAPIDSMIRGRPFVLIDSCEEHPTTDQVNFPNEEGARTAVQHLIGQQCRSIALVGYEFVSRDNLAHAQDAYMLRLRGGSSALLDSGREYRPDLVFQAGGSEDGIHVGHAIAARIDAAKASGRQPIDGVFCANDYVALGVIRGLADNGIRTPHDVKVIGFDGVSAGAYATPTLSTVQVDFAQLARCTLDLLVRRIERRAAGLPDDAPARITIGYRLTVRESSMA